MKKTIIITAIISLQITAYNLLAQNIGINATGAAPDASAGLDVSFTNKGLLVPRVALTALNAAGPIATPATSLLVYNTATAGAVPNNVTPGYYYWGGTKWIAIGGSGGLDWSLTGNTGTTVGTNFLGTIDNVSLAFKTNNAERMRILNTGNVGIGTTTPGYQLTLGGTGGVFGVENTATFSAKNAGGTYENYLWPRWSDNIMYLNYGSSGFNIRNNSSVSTMFMTNAGNVGIATTTPGYRLDLNTGTFAFGNGNVRTETRNDAGLQGNVGAQSGFFETVSPTNYPAGASSWWHLIDVRHSNNANNYALQLSGSFFDQKLYFRKTNGNPAQPWTELLSSANNPVSTSLAADYTISSAAWANVAPMTVTFTATKTTALVQFTCSGIAYTNSMAYVQFRIVNSTLGASIGGTMTHMQSYDDTRGTLTPWSCSFSKNMTGLTPGSTYTVVVQGKRAGIWGVYDAVIQSASDPDSQHMTLTVFP